MVMNTTTVYGFPAPAAGTPAADYDTEFATAMNAADAAVATSAVVTVSGTSHTIAASNATKTLRCTSSSATTITVANLTAGQYVNILRAGTGTVTVAAGGFTLVSRGSVFSLNGQWAMATVYCDAASHAVLTGDLA